MKTSLMVRFQSELESLARLKGVFDPKKHTLLLQLLSGGFADHRARQTHAEDLLAEYIASCPGQFAFHRGFKPSEEQLREALHHLFFDPYQGSVMDRHEHIIVNVFEKEDEDGVRELGWSRETFKRKQLRLLLKHLARHLAEQVADEDEAA